MYEKLQRKPIHIAQFIQNELGLIIVFKDDKTLMMKGYPITKEKLIATLKLYIRIFAEFSYFIQANLYFA